MAPNLPVDALLGTDICPVGSESKDGWSFAVWTRGKRKELEMRLQSASQRPSANHIQDVAMNPTEGQSIVELRGEEGDGDAPQQEEVLPGETGVGEGNVVISPDVEPQDGKPNPASDQCVTKEVRQHPGGRGGSTRAPDKQDIFQADPADLRVWQKEDPSLERAWELASENPVEKSVDRVCFVYQD